MQANQTPNQFISTRISTRKTRRFFATNNKAPTKQVTAMQRKAAKAHTLALVFKIIFG